jgi:ATP-dependent Clp protease ATP-binding subunit ClpC
MEKKLKDVVFGHSEIIHRISNVLKRARAGLKDPGKPIGSFLFVGPTGAGKSKLAKEIANYLFDKEQAFIRFDMTEYMEKFSISRVIGAPPGYVGYEKGGELTEKVRRYPYSLVLFDNIEKAHPDILNILLQILDEGVLTDGIGRKIDFNNTIIILTMHFDKRQKNTIGFNNKPQEFREGKEFVEKLLTPELRNRLDDVLEFNYLDENNLRLIVKEELKRISTNLAELGYVVKISDTVIDVVLKKATDKPDARTIKAIVRKCIEESLAFALLHKQSSGRRLLFMDTQNGKINFKFKE